MMSHSTSVFHDLPLKGMPLGRGTIERGCKHVLAHRLKQAGMRWNREMARGVSKARVWMKSGRWEEALALCPRRRRSYQRKEAESQAMGEAQSGATALAA